MFCSILELIKLRFLVLCIVAVSLKHLHNLYFNVLNFVKWLFI